MIIKKNDDDDDDDDGNACACNANDKERAGVHNRKRDGVKILMIPLLQQK
jgi:hypothetical protein